MDLISWIGDGQIILMKAIIISHFGPSVDNLVFGDIDAPEPTPGHVVIHVKAFGINHAEMHMRKGEWAESMPVSGIECVGTVYACPGGEFAVGTKVAALMGGMGRTINGSYAEFTNPPVGNVCAIESNLSWDQLAALPETYATAWTCLFRNLEVKAGQLVLVRGATSSFGRAAVNLAVNAGARVIATTRSEVRFEALQKLGASRVELEGPDLSERLAERGAVDAVLNLVGNSVLLDSMKIPRRGGRQCLAGFLGGLASVPDFNPLAQLPSGVHFSFFGSFHFGTPQFPLSDVPLQSIAHDVADGKFDARPARVFGFEDIREAHRVMEANEANGKLVVVIDYNSSTT